MIKENILIWDLETSGLGPESKILEIGAMLIIEGKIEKYQWMLNHHIDIPENITKINGITRTQIEEVGIEPKIALVEFLNIIKRADKHVTHNGFHFDIPFLVASFEETFNWDGWTTLCFKNWLRFSAYDTAVKVKADKLGRKQDIAYPRFADSIMAERILGLKYNLKQTCLEYGIAYQDAHEALGDIEMTYQVYLKQQNGT